MIHGDCVTTNGGAPYATVSDFNPADIKVFQVNETDWFAGLDAPSCVLAYLNDYDGEEETLDEFGEPVEVSSEAMQRLTIHDSDNNTKQTFRQSLDEMIAAEHNFPCMFASTEY